MLRAKTFLLGLLLFAVFVTGCAHAPKLEPGNTARETAQPTPLDTYVFKPDPNFSYKLVWEEKGDGWTGYVLDMTSQQWRSAAEVDLPIWKHYLTVVCPKKLNYPTALMVIGGGSNKKEPPKRIDALFRRVAVETQCVVASISCIPSEPLKFAGEDRKRSEDAIIAYTWDKFMRTGDAEWLLRLPMTKAVVRGMDAVQEFCASPEGGKKRVDNFVVAGASKRGWTTWTVTAVDKRVIGCVPMVIDLLNVLPSFQHHWSVYGQWAPAIDDYTEMHIMDWLGSKEFDAMLAVVDPYSYRARMTMPKYLINSCGDQFFLPDSWKFYLKDLTGPAYLRYVPNTGHPLNATVAKSVSAFLQSIAAGTPLPEYRWTFPDENTIRVETPSKPSAVKLWQATNPDARDFRIDVLGPKYAATELQDQGGGVYVGQVVKPEKGWTAYMVELTFPGPGEAPFTFSTPVRITPDTTQFQFEPPKEFPKGFLSN